MELRAEGWSDDEAIGILIDESTNSWNPKHEKRKATNRANAKKRRPRTARVPDDIDSQLNQLVEKHVDAGLTKAKAKAEGIRDLSQKYNRTPDTIRKKLRQLRNAT
ncbi:MAG TPA: hypothetical protein VMR74_13375 [Gammaproteobacteria bacterium]|nr:hypothetical protein [Gammaproteobacteria bacterium]